MNHQKIALYVGLGLLLGFLMLFKPVLFFVSLALLIIIGVVILLPYVGIILLITIAPFQPFIRELIGGSLIRFWRETLLLMIFSVALIKALLGKIQFNFFPKYRRTNPTLWAAIMFVSYMAIRGALGPHELQTLGGLAEYCLYSLFFVACLLLLTNSRQILGIFISVSIVAALMALGAIWESILGREYIISSHSIIDRIAFPRSASFMESPLELGSYLALSIPMILCSINEIRTRLLRLLFAIIAIIAIIGLFTTGSRMPWLQFVISILVYMALYPDFKFPKRFKATFITGVILVSLLVIAATAIPFIRERLASVVDWENDKANLDRIQRWEIALNHISEAPIIGKGLGAESLLRGKANRDLDLIRMGALVQESFILKIWLQSGLIGLLCFLYLYISAVKCAFSSRKLSDIRLRYFGVAITSCLFGLFIEIFITQTIHSWAINMIFWSFLAISILLDSDKLGRNRKLDIKRFYYLKHSSIKYSGYYESYEKE